MNLPLLAAAGIVIALGASGAFPSVPHPVAPRQELPPKHTDTATTTATSTVEFAPGGVKTTNGRPVKVEDFVLPPKAAQPELKEWWRFWKP